MYLQYNSQDLSIMKTFKGVVFASIVFVVYLQINDFIKKTQYPVFEKGADLH